MSEAERHIVPDRLAALIVRLERLFAIDLRQYAVSLATLGVALVTQLGSFVLLARALGPGQFGLLLILTAICSILVEVIGNGADGLMVRATSRDAAGFSLSYARSLGWTLLTALIVVPLGVAIVHFMFSQSLSLLAIAALIVSEALGLRLQLIAEFAALGHGHIGFTNCIRIVAQAFRLIAIALATLVFGVTNVEGWALWALISTLLVALALHVAIIVRYGPPARRIPFDNSLWGASFAANQLVRAVQASIDRLVIGAMLGITAAGLYGSGSRIVQVSLLPVTALLRILLPKFFREGALGPQSALALALSQVRVMLVLTGIIGIGLFACADFVVLLIGGQYADTAPVIRLLAPSPIIIGLHYLAADAMSGADMQHRRTIVIAGGAALSAALLAALAPAFGIAGAASAILLGQGITAALLWAMLGQAAHRHQAGSRQRSASVSSSSR
jgi:O-antigen/teichoic acid export membrane protein